MRIDSKAITVSVASRDDHRALLAFLMEQYPQLGWSESYMEWQYYRNPAGTAKSWVAKHDGKLVANYTAVPHALRVDGTVEPSWRVQDVITHPEYRGLGLYARLSDEANRFLQSPAFPLNFTFPNENSHPGFVKRGWLPSHRIPLWVSTTLDGAAPVGLEVEPLPAFGAHEERIWHSYCGLVRYGVERSAAFLNWKYFQNPRGGYSAFRVSSGGAGAVCVFKTFDTGRGETYAHLCDAFYEPAFAQVGEIVAFFRAFARSRGAAQATVWSPPESPLAARLRESAFTLNAALTRWLVLNPNSPTLDRVSVETFSHWHLSMGDSDVY